MRGLMLRGAASVAILALNLAFLVIYGLVLTGAYWFSDRLFDWGLWPLGAVLRIVLLIFAIYWIVGIISWLISAIRLFFFSVAGGAE